jgi:hypothetical protein
MCCLDRDLTRRAHIFRAIPHITSTADKAAASYDTGKEAQAREWVELVSGEPFAKDDFQQSLKDGILLCK